MSADEGTDPSPPPPSDFGAASRPSPLQTRRSGAPSQREGRGRSAARASAIGGKWKRVTVITHPLVQHNLTRLRDKRTGPQEFRRVLSEVASLMVYEATRSFSVAPI